MAEEESIVDAVCKRIAFDKEQIERNEFQRIELDSFNLSEFWDQFGSAVQALSNQVTKIGFLCGKEPYPNNADLSSMLQDMMQYYTMMRDLYLVLPEKVGALVFKAVTSATLNIMAALETIVASFADLSEKGASERLPLTGMFWDACNAVESLPRDNLQATLKVIEEERALAADAEEELNTTIKEDMENQSLGELCDDMWTESERDLAIKSIGLVKVTQVCLRSLHKAVAQCGSSNTPEHCKQLDHLARSIRAVSPALDDFVSELYHPVDFPKVVENAGKLADVLRSLVSAVKGTHCEQGISKTVVDNLLHFINHNHCKIDPNVTNPVPELSSLAVHDVNSTNSL